MCYNTIKRGVEREVCAQYLVFVGCSGVRYRVGLRQSANGATGGNDHHGRVDANHPDNDHNHDHDHDNDNDHNPDHDKKSHNDGVAATGCVGPCLFAVAFGECRASYFGRF